MRTFNGLLGIILISALGGSVADYLPATRAQDLSADQQLLVNIKAHIREELYRLPDYTCLESVARFHNQPARQHSKLEGMDTVRLEVVYSNHREWYGSPGDKNFSADNPFGFIGSGMIGTGAFAMIAHNIFEIAQITYQGREDLSGRSAVKYGFHLPRPALQIDLPGGSGTTGQEGFFWADPQSLDVIRVDARATEIPRYVPLIESRMLVNYGRAQLGGSSALLPQQADLHMLETTGTESYDRIDFTHCRAFSAQSAIHFEAVPHDDKPLPSPSPKTISAQGGVLEAVPPFLLVTVRLKTPITDKDAVGTLIEATISGDVRRKGKTVIPNGSLIRGRIRRLERYPNGRNDEFIVALEFTEVEMNGGPLRFYADLLKMDKRREVRPNLYEQVLVKSVAGVEGRTQTVTLPELPGVASFFVHGRTFTLNSGLEMVWRTTGLIRR